MRTAFLAFLIGFTFSFEAVADGHSNGKIELEGMGTWNLNILNAGKGNLSVTYDGLMGLKAVKGTKFGDNSTFRCVGGLLSFGGEIRDETGFCKIALNDGDTAFISYEGIGKMGVGGTGAWRFIGGTGKYETIAGKGTLKRQNLKAAKSGVAQTINSLSGTFSLK